MGKIPVTKKDNFSIGQRNKYQKQSSPNQKFKHNYKTIGRIQATKKDSFFIAKKPYQQERSFSNQQVKDKQQNTSNQPQYTHTTSKSSGFFTKSFEKQMQKVPASKTDNFFISNQNKRQDQLSSDQKFKHNYQNSAKLQTTKRDSFFIRKTRKFQEDSSPEQEFENKQKNIAKSPQSTYTPSSSGFFLKTSETQQQPETKLDKPRKLFDKKKWRQQKYSKKYKLEQWQERRKKNMLREYHKQIEDEPKYNVQQIYEKYGDQEENDNENNLNEEAELSNTVNVHSGASQSILNTITFSKSKKEKGKSIQQKFESKKEEKNKIKEEILLKKEERAKNLKLYKQKKLEKYKKLNKKTKKGQPIMKYRMEMLLEQIQKSVQ